MPEIAEGKTLAAVKAPDDAIVFGKVGTSGPAFQKAMTGKKVLDANQQGKYFWFAALVPLIMSSPPHPVFHLGMTGWIQIRGEPTGHYRPKESKEEEEWPPKYWRFILETDSKPKIEAAFVDARRFGRVRLLDCAAEDIRNTTPLNDNGPDPVIDKDILTAGWLETKILSKSVPIKSLLLDQAVISGLGNWVTDEVLYNAKLHPEQYSNTFSSEQIKQLHKSILYVCQTAVDLLADSSKFPEEWLFNHRWGKSKTKAPITLPNGAEMIKLTVGNRTSCVVPSVQKNIIELPTEERKQNINGAEDADSKKESKPRANASKKRKAVVVKAIKAEEEELTEDEPKGKAKKAKSTPKTKVGKVEIEETPSGGRRRSTRVPKTKE
ncbi:Formamidopyrimidine-DNA glycosylase [Lachnellula cervina]|uniref:Formamidopyrimidine-DNA glycosylase n=1 Tax=Lachnellula cervina TaxID=1316786 RepID=A0A7D8UW37_9HELO|nr:Formamidopyrimidine-DNA glycosylase [Lachnellula cervina]